MAVRTVILDRDGTLNVDVGNVAHAGQWQFAERAIEALQLLRDAGFVITIATNQSGIARGLYTEHDMKLLHEYVRDMLLEAGVHLAAIAYCPHGQNNECDCRKPKTGMAFQLEQELRTQINYRDSWTIGDKLTDVEFGRALGTNTALIRSRYWNDRSAARHVTLIVDSFHEAAMRICTNAKAST